MNTYADLLPDWDRDGAEAVDLWAAGSSQPPEPVDAGNAVDLFSGKAVS